MTKRFGPIVIALVLFFFSIALAEPIINYLARNFWLKPGVAEAVGTSQAVEAFQGTIFQEKALESPDILPLYGSSELSSMSAFHPTEFFYDRPTRFIPFLVGRGGYQDLIQALCLGTQEKTVQGKKVAIILSPQWFTPQGISNDYFAMNFSPLQAYKTMSNPLLTENTKQQIATRLLDFPDTFNAHPVLRELLLRQANPTYQPTFTGKLDALIRPLDLTGLKLKDAIKTISLIHKLNPATVEHLAGPKKTKALPSWEEIRMNAADAAKPLVTNNDFGILDSYYDQLIKQNLQSLKNSQVGATLYPSKEYDDLRILLQVLKEEGAKPLFIIVPVNGCWYDYTGFPKTERLEYYARVEKIITGYGFSVANFGGHEYDRYFLRDIMHLGWKGWVDVDEALNHFYQSNL